MHVIGYLTAIIAFSHAFANYRMGCSPSKNGRHTDVNAGTGVVNSPREDQFATRVVAVPPQQPTWAHLEWEEMATAGLSGSEQETKAQEQPCIM